MSEPRIVHLQPGDFHFAGGDTRMHTLLGSCVAITMWHPGRRVGGMCHYLLSTADPRVRSSKMDARYADDAVELFAREVDRHAARPADFQVKIFGGADQFPAMRGPLSGVAGQNARTGLELLDRYGFHVTTREIGGEGSRRLIFEVATGHVWVRTLKPLDAGARR
ncbi:chemotaxis protein CheD [Actinoplanes sp. NPDC049265]|uniref:chemotaxis protein CheD n=1 Tax=Actinoplanes sp. NPDC049265 TaxID=3363902 RepID=UPI0037119E01